MFELNGVFTSVESPKFSLNNLSIYFHDITAPISYAAFLSNQGVKF